MKNQLSQSLKFQEILFDRIRNELPSQLSVVDAISDLLNISTDAAYRRLRGEKKLDIDEMFILCNKFNISADAILRMETNQLAFQYSQLDLKDLNCYLEYMKKIAERVSLLSSLPDSEIKISAVDIPIFHFMPYKELTLFKIFAWTNSVYEYKESFENFTNQLNCSELFSCYDQIAADYSKIPSVEVWTEQSIDTILRLIDYYFESGYFSKKETPVILCEQIMMLISNLQNWTEVAEKGQGIKKSNFLFELSEIDLENNFIIFRNTS